LSAVCCASLPLQLGAELAATKKALQEAIRQLDAELAKANDSTASKLQGMSEQLAASADQTSQRLTTVEVRGQRALLLRRLLTVAKQALLTESHEACQWTGPAMKDNKTYNEHIWTCVICHRQIYIGACP
jgi:hypothetical protein